MHIVDAKIGIIQDDEVYIRLAKLVFKDALTLDIASTLPFAMQLLERLSSGEVVLDLLGLDENLTARDNSGNDGRVLYTRFRELKLDDKVHLVDISTTPTLSIPRVGGFTPMHLASYLESIKL